MESSSVQSKRRENMHDHTNNDRTCSSLTPYPFHVSVCGSTECVNCAGQKCAVASKAILLCTAHAWMNIYFNEIRIFRAFLCASLWYPVGKNKQHVSHLRQCWISRASSKGTTKMRLKTRAQMNRGFPFWILGLFPQIRTARSLWTRCIQTGASVWLWEKAWKRWTLCTFFEEITSLVVTVDYTNKQALPLLFMESWSVNFPVFDTFHILEQNLKTPSKMHPVSLDF